MSLLDLPTELLFSIYSYVEPDDLVNFAVTCKHMFAVGEGPVQEHKSLQQKYGVYRCLSHDGCQSWNLLYDVLKNPRVACYVKELELSADRNTEWDSDEEWCSAAVEQFQSLGADWRMLIGSGNDGAIIAQLLPRLSHLQKLNYVPTEDADIFLDVLKEATENWNALNLDSLSSIDFPFRQLKTVSLAHWDTEDCMDLEWLFCFSRIPSVHSITGHMVGCSWNGYIAAEAASELSPSETTSLTMTDSSIGMDVLELILEGMPKLRDFCYEYGGAIIDTYEWDPKAIFKMLSKHNRHSLEILKLTDGIGDGIESEIDSVSLVPFSKLKYLLTDWDALLPDPDEEENQTLDDEALSQGFFAYDPSKKAPPVDISGLLPSSLEVLLLRTCEEDWLNVFTIVLENKEEKYPNLRKLGFSMGDVGIRLAREPINDFKMQTLRGAAAKVGVEVKYHLAGDLDDPINVPW